MNNIVYLKYLYSSMNNSGLSKNKYCVATSLFEGERKYEFIKVELFFLLIVIPVQK